MGRKTKEGYLKVIEEKAPYIVIEMLASWTGTYKDSGRMEIHFRDGEIVGLSEYRDNVQRQIEIEEAK